MAAVPRRDRIIGVRARSVTVFVFALVALLLFSPTSALAHDALTSSTPSDGETLTALPGEVQLTLSNPPSGLGATIIVTDSAGTNWAEGPVSITNNIATQQLRTGAPAGEYTVQWRVVSADSHPIEGTFPFTTTEGTPVEESGQAASGIDAESTANTDPADNAGTGVGMILMIVLGGIALIAGLIVLTRRNLRTAGKK